MEYLENDKIINIQEKALTIKLKVEVAKLVNQYKQDKSQTELAEIVATYMKAENENDKSALITKANLLSKAENDIDMIEHNANITLQINKLISMQDKDFDNQPIDILEKNANSFCDKAKLRNRNG